MMKKLLFVPHAPSINTSTLADECHAAMTQFGAGLIIHRQPPLQTSPADVLACDGLVIGTTENIGYMAGLTKDLFDRGYNHWLEHTQGLPVAFYIRAGLDGTATAAILDRLSASLHWRLIRPPLILKGDFTDHFTEQVAELGGGFAAGLEGNIF